MRAQFIWTMMTSTVAASVAVNTQDCKNDPEGKSYTGTVNVTVSGRVCQRWDSQFPHTPNAMIDAASFPDATLEEAANYCRNPDSTPSLWCYTTDTDVRWEYCAVPDCTSTTNGPATTTEEKATVETPTERTTAERTAEERPTTETTTKEITTRVEEERSTDEGTTQIEGLGANVGMSSTKETGQSTTGHGTITTLEPTTTTEPQVPGREETQVAYKRSEFRTGCWGLRMQEPQARGDEGVLVRGLTADLGTCIRACMAAGPCGSFYFHTGNGTCMVHLTTAPVSILQTRDGWRFYA